ncbi:MAG: hypothetical protein KGD67_11840, partial [Candidatus Lokiarchaeota archaeon]|nr:hypothetical protein [Candidatus Lokiarchaeota archaeon]
NVISTIQEISITKKSYLAKNLELEKLYKKREFIRTNLKRVPSDELLKNSINIINRLNQEKGQLEQLISNSQIEVDSIRLKVEEIEKQIINSKKELRKMEKENRKIDLALKVQEVLKEYQDEIKESKLRALEIELLRYFKIICGKKDIIQRVSIDKNKFEIKIFNEEHSGQEKLFSLETNDKLNHEQLSAGEKQLFIFSLIWALIR